jgi:acyl transferase domain-containing protein/acyl carrier protein
VNNEFDIAIVGMSCRLPGARNLDEFWHNLAGGIESITRFSDQEILKSGVAASYLSNPTYVKAAPVLEEPGHFAAGFFGFSPMEAKTLDPQHRILLELAYEALEHAGYDPERYEGRIGVFTGSAMNTYFMNAGLSGRFAEEYIPTLIGNDKDFLSTRISYKLNLKGPSLTVQTACSTALVAVHLARQSLLSQETDMALAGAISVRVPHRAGYFYDGGGVVSPDGHVRAFDAKANGTVFGSGGGILVLKRLADALADRDTIHAVIRGSAVNNDGSEKAGYTAPSVNSQADAVVEALANAGVEADSISYIEAHGSGTPIGDPIEITALTKAFRTSTKRSGYCAIGSVKTNVGHLDAAAGVAGIIKTVLALEHRKLPATLHFSEANPEIDFPATPFYVNTHLREWTGEGPKRAGVMSTGMGGTNAHVVLEEAPELGVSIGASPPHLLILSAKTETALDQATHRLREFLYRNDSVNMSDVAYTLQIGRKVFPHRRYLICADREDAIIALGQEGSKRVLSNRTDESRRPVMFLLPGIGDHYVGMAHDLYETCAVFKQEVDRCSHILEPHLGIDIRTIIYPNSASWKKEGQSKGIDLKKMLGRKTDAPEDQDARNLNRTLFAQPALFTIEYAMSRLWQSLGIEPAAIVGHSMGEYVAACLAGVLSLENALRLIATRAKLVNELPQGAMLAVMLPENELLSLLLEDLSISLINGPSLCVVAGPIAAVAEFEKTLTARSVICRNVQNAHAFHSRMLDPIVKSFQAEVKRVQLHEPRIPYISNVTGKWITGREATNPAYWAMHANHTARFSDALHELWQFKDPILLEAGPGRTLGVLAMQHPDRRDAGHPVRVSSIRHHYENQSDVEFLCHGIGRLWLSGIEIKWDNVHIGGRRRRVPLPTYPFERQNYWLEAESRGANKPQEQNPVSENSGVDDWFYVPTWERTPVPRETKPENTCWLIVADQYGGGASVKAKLDALQRPAGLVRFGKTFHRCHDGSFELNPSVIDDYVKLFQELEGQAAKAINIIHLGSLTRNDNETALYASNQDFGFYSLLHIAQAIGEIGASVPIKIGIVTNRIHEVTGEEPLDPAMATVLGPCGVIPKEFPNVKCFNIDLPDNQAIDNLPDEVFATILSEFAEPSRNRVVAYRGRYRWERRYNPVKLPSVPTSTANEPADIKRLRRGGVYLITGGTGGLGLVIAKYLATTCQPKIVLTKKTAFPAKSMWRALANAADTAAPVRRTINALLELEDLGAEVEVLVADSSDKRQMQKAFEEIRAKVGAIHGVIHAAGIVRAGLIQAKTKEVADSVLAPKVYGTMILLDLLKGINLDFLVLFSSITSIITPYAESDYSAANSFLDAFAHFANAQKSFHTIAINWPGWKEVGQLAELETLPGVEGWKEAALKKAITTKDGLEAFKRALNSDFTQVIVSPESLNHLLEQSQVPFDPTIYLAQLQSGTKVVPRQDSSQRNGGNHPANEVEAILTEIWNSVFGFEQVDIHDNFSQLGGHSLLAMQIVTKVRSAYHIDLTLREFFEAPTIAQLSSVIQARIIGVSESLTNGQGRPLLSPMGQRFFCASRFQTAFFFGPSNQQVFAIYHRPLGGRGQVLTVICPPLFNEYMRTQLALRELAISLAERGQHVVRFDYRGTGDSFGDLDEVTISDWVEDIALAVREGCDLSGSSLVQLLGVRGGALLACRSVGACTEVQRLVLWDPVPDGAGYLQALRRIQVAVTKANVYLSRADRRETLYEYAGHRLSERMLDEFRLLNASAYSNLPKSKLYVVNTSPEAGFPVPGVSQDVAPFSCNWETDLQSLIMPKPVLERLTACLTIT